MRSACTLIIARLQDWSRELGGDVVGTRCGISLQGEIGRQEKITDQTRRDLKRNCRIVSRG